MSEVRGYNNNDLPLYLGYQLYSKKLTLEEVKDRIAHHNEWTNKEVVPEFSIDKVIDSILEIKKMSKEDISQLSFFADYSEASYELGLKVVDDAVKNGYRKQE
jgi:hypothetical protein